MKQQSFTSLSYQNKKKHTRREKFFGPMDRVTVWSRLLKRCPSITGKPLGSKLIGLEV